MIVSASRIATASGSGAVGAHVFSGPKNESITVVQGSRAELDDMVRDARDHGAKYSIRHFKVNPEEATTREEALAVMAALGREFGFDPARAVMVEHQKRRYAGAGFDRHWHLMVPEVDPIRGRVLDAHWMRARQEKVSRVAEIELGHHQVRGKWNRAVEAALRAEGRDELADRVHPLTEGDRPGEAFTAVQHQVAERRGGASMPEMKAAVVAAWQRSDSGGAFRTALAEQGLAARPGDKKGVWLIEATGPAGEPVLVGSLARLTRVKAEEVGARMAEPVPAGAPAEAALPVAPVSTSEEPTAADVAPPIVEVSAPAAALPEPVSAVPVEAPHQAAKLRADAAAAEAAPKITGGQHEPNPNHPSLADGLAAIVTGTPGPGGGDEAHLDGRGPARAHRDGDARPGRDAADDGPQGTGADPVRGDPGSDHGRHADPAPVAPGAAAGDGNEPARPGGDPSRSDRREPSQARAQAGRDRVQARRTAVGIAAAVQARGGRLAELTRALASPPTVAGVQTERARAAMAESRARVAAVMATAPFPEPASRNKGHLQNAARDRVAAIMAAQADAAAAAAERASQFRARVGLIPRALAMIGLETPALRQAAEAAREAEQAQQAAKGSRLDYRDDLAQADRSGAAEADRRQREQDRWEDRPDVRAAHREEAGNRMVAAALREGDPEIKDILTWDDGLRLAGEMLLRREVERMAEIRHQQRHDQRVAGPARETGAVSAPGGPRR